MNSSRPTIEVRNLCKRFRYYSNRWQKLQDSFLPSDNHLEELWALKEINFTLTPKTTLGVIGMNGSGKTTLLQLIAGLLKPTEGSALINGTLATLLELGSSFQSESTGRENIYVSAGLSGFSRREIEDKVDEIISFSELEEFIDRPVKHYSSGMLMRLAFATAISVHPDILLIDEVFAVGDIAFQHKCTQKLRKLQKEGATIVIVTHDMMAVKSLCNLAILIDHGKQIAFGNPEDVTNQYLRLIAKKIKLQSSNGNGNSETDNGVPSFYTGEFTQNLIVSEKTNRHGSGEGKISGIEIFDSDLSPIEVIPFGQEVTFRFYIEFLSDVAGSGIGFFVRDRYGNDVLGINTFEEKKDLGDRKKGDRIVVDFRLPIYLRPGSYSISPGLSYHRSEPRYLDWIDNAAFFQVEAPLTGRHVYGFFHVPNQITIQVAQNSSQLS